MIDISSLNDRQIEAVNWQDGPLLVLAGPGSGKTKVLTSRIARLVQESSTKHFRILALTFTNKAAAEMRQRIELLVPGSGNRVLLTTFHSFAGDVLRQHGHLIGLKPDFTIITQEGERIALLDEAIATTDLHTEELNFSGERLLPLINRMLENDVSADSISKMVLALPADQQGPIQEIYGAYRSHLISCNSLDFPTLIAEAVRIFREISAVCNQVRRIYKFICVDEFQDTNLSQYHLLTQLINQDSNNLFVVADDDQIIYQWNGASPERLNRLRSDFNMNLVQLPANYRCPPEVIEIANKLIAHNATRSLDKQNLQALKPVAAGNAVRVGGFNSLDEELSWVASDIASRSELERSRCVVLARTRKALEGALEQLVAKGVPAYLAMRKDEFVSAPLRWLHAALRLANNPQDREQARRLCKAFYALEGLQVDPANVISSSEAFDGSALRAFANIALGRAEIGAQTSVFLFSAIPALTDKLDFRSFTLATFGWAEMLQDTAIGTDNPFADYGTEKSTWSELVAEIEGQFGQENVTLNVLLQELDMRSKAPSPANGAVPCFTIHASKGLEFGHVYLIAMVEDQLPSWAAVKKGADSREMQEERRNCFVAITRTEDSLTLTYSQRVFGWNKAPSRFLREMGLIN
ncbi:ATP-dependent helicase [Polymorphobacter multimanifer]|uniref:ATP-dependent helicase n=1 Tax=Polymorphobacter multimanifer TaxID=1070431 RepID=UPI001A9C87D7|nr:ATP-dependent helicase [Polymorphobacter multimanifer]